MRYELVVVASSIHREKNPSCPVAFILCVDDDRKYLEGIQDALDGAFENTWINDREFLDTLPKVNPSIPPASWPDRMKRELYNIIVPTVLPNGGVLIHNLVDALHEFIARREADMRHDSKRPPGK